ncbi:hypothetical protein EVAR_57742_1 [Eumeta japonica]|uniref:Uncharacterized protein n=1 Tax=Eumeta variegata TaxID=151549 RepID=A0A4C1Y9Z3_EUMVA|nr:hypothetical protein EVAR_57742_1 [Eumeta japonica]
MRWNRALIRFGRSGTYQEQTEKIIDLPDLGILAPPRVYALCLGTAAALIGRGHVCAALLSLTLGLRDNALHRYSLPYSSCCAPPTRDLSTRQLAHLTFHAGRRCRWSATLTFTGCGPDSHWYNSPMPMFVTVSLLSLCDTPTVDFHSGALPARAARHRSRSNEPAYGGRDYTSRSLPQDSTRVVCVFTLKVSRRRGACLAILPGAPALNCGAAAARA